jgi:hypothetical protein
MQFTTENDGGTNQPTTFPVTLSAQEQVMFRFKCSLSLIVACVLTWIGPGLLQAEEADESKSTYRVMYRIGTKGEWREAADAGSPAKSKDGADQIAGQLREKYRGGLAAVEVDVRATRPAPPKNAGSILTRSVWSGSYSIKFTYETIAFKYIFSDEGTVSESNSISTNRGKWKQEGNTVTIQWDSGTTSTLDLKPHPFVEGATQLRGGGRFPVGVCETVIANPR